MSHCFKYFYTIKKMFLDAAHGGVFEEICS